MRLTLRSLLAYMDDLLDPQEQEDLGHKIEQSAFATELIHRARDAVRRTRLSAPAPAAGETGELHESSLDVDANSMAEYLDHILPPERVSEFERSCLEAGPDADMLLAEAASCHHILAMVLGEPADVDSDMRARMYGLVNLPTTHRPSPQQLRIEPAHSTPQAEPAAAEVAPLAMAAPVDAAEAIATPVSMAAPAAAPTRPDRPVVPDYLVAAAKARRRSRMLTAALLAGLVIGGTAAYLVMTTPEPKLPVEIASGDMGNPEDQIAAPIVGSEQTDDVAKSSAGEEATTEAATVPATATTEAPPFEPAANATTTASSAPVLPPVQETPAAPSAIGTTGTTTEGTTRTAEAAVAPPATEIAESATTETESTTATPASPTAPDADAATALAAAAGGGTAAAPPVDDSPVTPADATNVAPPLPPAAPGDAAALVASNTPAPGASEAADIAAADASESPVRRAATKEVGGYIGNNDVLLRHDEASGDWVRLGPRTALAYGDRLASLPTFRTHIVVADANVYIGGGTTIELNRPEAGSSAELTVEIPAGRLIINSISKGNRIEITSGEFRRLVELGPSASLAIEVERPYQPGANLDAPPLPIIHWYLTNGTVSWGPEGEATTATAKATWTTNAGTLETPVAAEQLPDWIDRESLTPMEQRAHDVMAESLATGDSVNVPLLELTDPTTPLGKRREVRALAAQSCALVGQFEPLVKSLSDADLRGSWKDQIATLRTALARDASAAAEIREAFASQRGEEAADDLMEMLIGFDPAAVGKTQEEIQRGPLIRLVRWLESDDLATRVLALNDINEITGTNRLGDYRPEQTAAQRQRAMKYYWDRLESGELTPKE